MGGQNTIQILCHKIQVILRVTNLYRYIPIDDEPLRELYVYRVTNMSLACVTDMSCPK